MKEYSDFSDLRAKPKVEEICRYYRRMPLLDMMPGSHTIRNLLGLYEKKTLDEALFLLALNEPEPGARSHDYSADITRQIENCGAPYRSF